MAEARFTVRACGPLVSYQDGGRPGMMRFGVAASGPMDRLAHAAAQAALGQPQGATALEVSLGGLELACDAGEVSFSVTGGEFQVVHAGAIVKSGCVRTIRAGETLAIRPGRWGSWAYLAFCGELACRPWAGRAATHSTSGLGGGLLASGSTIVVRESAVCEEREGELAAPVFTPAQPRVRVVLGPQTEHFEADCVERLLAEDYSVSPACDRMGMRLEGPALPLRQALSIPSEPIVRGSIQVNGEGVASILLADHQTTGGYPKIATVVSCDLDAVAQRRPRDVLRFEAVEAPQAVALARAHAAAVRAFLSGVGQRRGTLLERLLGNNLVSGMIRAERSDSQDGPA
jgi:allophanate hydrolase